MLRQSPRFAVTEMSKTVSAGGKCALIGEPIGRSRSVRMSSPAWSSLMPSSRAEHIMPWETSPRIFVSPMTKPPGSSAPGSATGTTSPALKFFAPQTIWRTTPSPTSTRQTLRWSLFACGSKERIFPMTTCSSGGNPAEEISSTSSPIIGSASAIFSAGTSLKSAYLFSHCRETFIIGER